MTTFAHDFREMHNEDGGRAGKMNIIEEAIGTSRVL